jgi:hypothetical protein
VYGAERGIKRMIIYGLCTERSGTEKKGMVWEHIPMFILYWWMTVYGAERGIKRMIIEICT